MSPAISKTKNDTIQNTVDSCRIKLWELIQSSQLVGLLQDYDQKEAD